MLLKHQILLNLVRSLRLSVLLQGVLWYVQPICMATTYRSIMSAIHSYIQTLLLHPLFYPINSTRVWFKHVYSGPPSQFQKYLLGFPWAPTDAWSGPALLYSKSMAELVLPKSGSVQFYSEFCEPRTWLRFSSSLAEPRTNQLEHVQEVRFAFRTGRTSKLLKNLWLCINRYEL